MVYLVEYSKGKRLYVAAIDIGSTFSGFAHSSKVDWTKVQLSGMMPMYKAPTTVLLNPDKSFHSYGYKAEIKYDELAEENEHREYFYFYRFKMAINIKKVRYCLLFSSRTVSIFDEISKSPNVFVNRKFYFGH